MDSTKKRKIIHIYNRGYTSNFPSKESPYFYLAGWAQLQAVNILKFTGKYEQEIWRPEREVDVIHSRRIKNVECKLFPHKKNIRFLKIPISLIRSLKKEAKENHILINLHYIHYIQSIWLIFLFRKYPIFVSHHGSFPFEFQKKSTFFKKIFFNKFLAWVDRKVLSWVDHFSVITKTEKEYLAQVVGENKVVLEQGRKHFKEWQPLDKNEARKKLGIDLKKKVLMYIGSYYKLKGVDHLIKAFQVLKKKYEIELLVVGGLPEDPLYMELKESGARDYGRVPNNEMVGYYSASDVFSIPSFDKNLVNFGGLATSMIEAMACNIPIVSKQLLNLPAGEWEKVGEVPETPDDVVGCIEKILENPGKYSPRETAKKFYDFEAILKDNIDVYDRLFSRYYRV